jgi:hypothetical protein
MAELRVGHTLIVGAKRKKIDVRFLERGGCCKGIHVNIVRRDTHSIKDRKGRIIGLNPDRGAFVHSDGCYAACTVVEILDDGDR